MANLNKMKKDNIIVLYGSTGDLTFRKLLPAITELYKNKDITEKTLILALGRREFTTPEYLQFIFARNNDLDLNILGNIVKYHKMQITDKDDYESLRVILEEATHDKTQVIHYLAVAPELMIQVSNLINEEKIVIKNNLNEKVIFEKPFGSNYLTARKINEQLWKNFNEKQIYRIDHYLGKEIISNILDFRFTNNVLRTAFEPKNLNSIDVVVKEEVGILDRGTFYDANGATKDMFQSHILQMVSLLVMDKPKEFNGNAITDEKVKVLKKLSHKKVVFGQYNGYLAEENVSSKSLTETLLEIDLIIKNKFKKVSINVLTGKKLGKKETYIQLNIKDGSTLRLNMYPEISVELKTSILNDNMDFKHVFNIVEQEYAKLILAAINSNKESFVRGDEIEVSWQFVDNLLKTKTELMIYNEDGKTKN